MKRSTITRSAVTSVLAGAALLVTASPATAAVPTSTPITVQATSSSSGYWAAIAISRRTGNVGYTTNYSSSAAAANAAVRKCNASDCTAVVRVTNGCAAVAQAPNRAWGWAWAGSRADAERRAVGATPGKGARALGWVCTAGHR